MVKREITALILLICMGAFTHCTKTKSDDSLTKVQPVPSVNDLPNMQVTLLDGSKVNLREASGKTIIIIFHPDCDHCQREAKQIEENLMAFGKNTLYFVSSDPVDEIATFASDYLLANRPNVYFGWTPMEEVLNNFGSISTPSLYIYSGDQRLIKVFNGEVDVALVFKYV